MTPREHYTECFEGFPPPGEITPKKLARRADPETSKEAAEVIVPHLVGLHQWAVECVRKSPGKTSRELAVEYCPTDPRTINRRLGECERLKLVRRGKARTCTVSGRSAAVWYPL